MFKVAIDNGHGLETNGKRTPPFEDGKQIKEKEFNRPTAVFLMQALQRCGIETVDCAPGWDDISLGGRVKIANDAKADVLISVHYNAFRGNWDETKGGVETYHYPDSAKGKELATCVQKYLAKGTEMPNRGVKEYNFYVCRETNMPAILCECGFMDVKSQAELMLNEAYQRECAEEICQGVCEYLGVKYVLKTQEIKEENNEYYNVGIMGENLPTKNLVEYLWGYVKARGNHNVPPEVPQLYLDEGKAEGVRGDIAFCQAMKETGFFNFGNVAQYEWHNPCGLGVTGAAGVGERFDDWQTGIRAHIQHLKAYASTEPLNNACVDNRFKLVTRGIAPKWTDLNGRWAVPGNNYGQDIMDMYVAMCKSTPIKIQDDEEIKEKEDTPVSIEELKEKIVGMVEENKQLKADEAALEKEVADLKTQLQIAKAEASLINWLKSLFSKTA